MAINTSQVYFITFVEEPFKWKRDNTLANKFQTEMKEAMYALIKVHMNHLKEFTEKLAEIGAPIAFFEKYIK